MTLSQFKKKRNPNTTSEPFGSTKKKSKKLHFVVQKHAASHLHYDFRLEVDGVLKSWAVPKGPSLDPSEKHLAVLVEDHPFDYLQFEGVIEPGNYGAGTVMVWDEGIYFPLNDKGEVITEKQFLEGFDKGKLSFFLEGKKLQGRFSLVRMKTSSGKENWLLIKANDEYASTENVLEQERSALSGRTMEEIEEQTEMAIRSNTRKKSTKEEKKKSLSP